MPATLPTPAEVPAAPLVALVAAAAATHPDAVAVEAGADRLTYAELLEMADRIAGHLRARGVRRGDLVAVAMPRGVALVAALLGVHRAGAAYLPLDPDHPAERLSYVLADSAAAVLLTAGHGPPAALGTSAAVVDVGALPPGGQALPTAAPRPDDPAYVIYTSGSTGRPKGVMVTHAALSNFLCSMRERPGLPPGAALPAVTTVSFDIAALELFLPLLVGGRVVVANRADARDPERLATLLSRVDAKVMQATPATWRLLLDAGWVPPAGFTVLCGGEKLPADLARRLCAAGVRLWDLYGPTETTIWSSAATIVDGLVADFAPVANTTLHILDERLRPVAAGDRGELYIGGAGVALGYLGRTRLTADRFVPDPYGPVPGARLYRTGDLARHTATGAVDILGRTDDQLKIRGYRVEPAEIEDALTRHPGVAAAVVVGVGADPRLVGYILATDPAGPPATDELHAHCSRLLPEHLIPAQFTAIDALPTTPNGKVDRAALSLAARDALSRAAQHVPQADQPGTPGERRVARVLAEVLGLPAIGPHDDFFLRGGHSLLATRAVARLRADLGTDLPVSALFEARTAARLAARLDAAAGPAPPIPPAPPGPLRLSFAQERMWLLHQLDPASLAYLEPLAVPLPGPVDRERAQAAVSALFARHEILRTRYAAGDDGPVQLVDPPAPVALPDVVGEPREVLAGELARPFDLSAGPPVRVRLAGDTVVFVIHHIAVDDRSLEVLAADLTALYAGTDLPPPQLRYADHAAWERDRMVGPVLGDGLTFWRERLDGLEPTELPTDRPRPARWDPRAGTERFTVDAALAARIERTGAARGATPFVTLLAAFLALATGYAGRDDVAVGVPVAGRDRAELDGLVGLFVNTIVLRVGARGHMSFEALVAAVRDEVVAAYPHADIPFELVVRDLAGARDLSRNPLFGLMFALHETVPAAGAAVPDLHGAKFDLGLHLTRRADGGLDGRIEYPVAIFDAATVAALAARYVALLAAASESPALPLRDLLVAAPTAAPARLGSQPLAAGAPIPAAGARPFRAVCAMVATGDGVAVRGQTTLTYAELDAAANRMAHRLRALGARPGTLVVVRLPRTPDLVVALLAVLRSGAAYLPLDPAHPVGRLRQALDDSGAPIVVAYAGSLPDLPPGVCQLAPDDPADRARIAAEPLTPPAVEIGPDDLAYVVYTSGSTGRPKGAMVTHGGLANYSLWAADTLRPQDGAGSPLHTSLAYDLALTALYPTLLAGAAVDLVDDDPAGGVQPLARALTARAGREPYGVLKLTPTHLDLLAAGGAPPAARCLVVGGEQLRGEQLAAWTAQAPRTRIVNSYGPAETAVASSIHSVLAADVAAGPVPIGCPIPGVTVHLLNDSLRAVPDGAPGEICIGGVGVGRGYLADPRLTADRFVPDPCGPPGARLYRTGDLGRRRPDGNLMFLGRRDDQVKIRGFRVEPGETEHVLAAHPDVRAAAVVVDTRDPGNPRLAAHVVPSGDTVSAVALRAYLTDRLPAHQVPTLWGTLPALPLLGNGKLDRQALPQLTAASEVAYQEPASPAEATIADIWAEVLGVDRVGRADRFFDLGGQSLLATRIAARLAERFGLPVSVRDVFAGQSVAQLAEILAGRMQHQLVALFGEPPTPGASPVPALPVPALPVPVPALAVPALALEALPPIRTVPRTGPLPLSFGQRRLWFLDQLDPGGTEYLVTTALRLRGPLDVEALDRALTTVVRRHEILRTRYLTAAEPGQVVDDPPDRVLLAVGPADPDAVLAEELATPVDLATGPVLRARLVATGQDEHLLILVVHHIAIDGWSIRALAAELEAAYQGADLPTPPVQYADFAAWQRERMSGPTFGALLDHWRLRLAGVEPTELPTDRPRPAVRNASGAVHRFTVPADVVARLDGLARQSSGTPFMAALAGFFALLVRYTGRTDLAVGVPVTGRHRPEVEDVIGFFVNTVVLRADAGGDPDFAGLLGRVRDAAGDAFRHDELPFERLVEELAPHRDLSGSPLIRLLFAFREESTGRFRLPGLAVTEQPVPGRTAKFDLTLELTRLAGGGLAGEIEYATALFDSSTVERLARHYVQLLAEATTHPQTRLSRLAVIDAAELAAVTNGRAGPDRQWPEGGLPELIARRAAAAPDAVAVECGPERFCHAEVDAAANRLAHHLRAAGIGRDDVVGICLPRRAELVVAILGVLRAGAAYLPLGPRDGVDRQALMLRDAGACLLITAGAAPAAACPVLDLRVEAPAIADRPGDAAPVATDLDALAYVIYTSGSTGRPKGVGIPHRGIRNRVLWAIETFHLGPADRLLQKTAVTFDASVWELLGPLVWGGTVVLPPDGVESDPAAMAAEVAARRITVLQGVPSFFRLLAAEPGLERCAALRLVFSAGEALPVELAHRLASRTGATVVNTYGPTEASIDVTWWRFEPPVSPTGQTVPIGQSIVNTRAVVVTPDGFAAPIGVLGELHVAGEALARGYLGQPRLTANRFVPDPYGPPGARAYRTGDLVRRTPAGVLEFRGRVDAQLKIRGVRVEPGEVESVLARHPQVRAAAVAARPGSDGQPTLAAYLVLRTTAGGPADGRTAHALREFLLAHLPEPYVPSVFVTLDRLPVTASGKLDRSALPDPVPARAAGAVPPRTPAEKVVADVFADVLGLDAVDAEDDFFDLGGHSLLAARIAGRLRAAFGVAITVRMVFEDRTVARLAARAATPTGENTAPSAGEPAAPPAGGRGPVPLSFAQRRMWFLELLHPGAPQYHVTWAHRLTGGLDAAALAGALSDLAARHEMLRTRYVTAPDGSPAQVVDGAEPLVPRTIELDGGEAALPALLRALAGRRFDLAARPPLVPYLIRIAPDDHVLAVVMHHITTDAWSEGILAKELSTLYAARLAGRVAPLGPAPPPYTDYAAWQREQLTGDVLDHELSHWRHALAGLPPVELPTDRPRPPVRDGRGAAVDFHLPAEVARPLVAHGRARGATAFMTFLAVFGMLLHRYTAGTDLAVGTPVAGRGRPELEGVIGFFVNTVVIRIDAGGDQTAATLIDRVRDRALDVFSHDELPFDRLVEELAPQRELSRSPLVDVIFDVRDTPDEPLVLPGLRVRRVGVPRTTAKFDLTLTLTAEADGGYRGEVEYATALFHAATMRRLAGHFRTLAAAVAVDPDRRISRLALLPDAELRQILAEWNSPPWADAGECLHEAFLAQAARTPDAVAVIGTRERLSYAELAARSAVLARRLRRAGVGRDKAVAVYLDRSPAVFVVLLAVLRAGGAFVPLDAAQPAERLSRLLDDLRPVLVVTDQSLRGRLGPAAGAVPVLVRDEPAADGLPDGDPGADVDLPSGDPASAAYMIYTSGSTGRPKAVVIPHGALTHHCRTIAEVYDIRAGDRGVLMAALTFDLAIEQMAVPLVAGAAVVVCEDRFWPPHELPDRFGEHGVTQVLLPPAYYREMMAGVRPGDPRLAALRTMGVGADVVTHDDARRWFATGLGARFINGYGPTEATIACVTHTVSPAEVTGAPAETAVPIGRPVPGCRAYVLDARLQPVPVGVAGELCVGGPRVSRGYLRRPRLTADRFVPDPYGRPGDRLYRTGDQARLRPDGVIEFLGRIDTQVKIRGFRIELGEIEAALAGHPGVRAAAVAVQESAQGDRRLVGYAVPEPDLATTPLQVREHLRERLPEYMVPSVVMWLDALPMTSSGKVDRNALPAPEPAMQPEAGDCAADRVRTEVEEAIAEVWADVLGRPTVSLDDDFFDIGGHSLLATRVLVRLRDLFGLDIPLKVLFEATSVAALAAALERLAEQAAAQDDTAVPATRE